MATPTPIDSIDLSAGLQPIEIDLSAGFQPKPTNPPTNPAANITVPSAGRIPGVTMPTAKVTPGQAAATVVAGAALPAALTAAPAVAGGVEGMLSISEAALGHLAENYPLLTKLAAKLGYGVGAAGAYKVLNKLGVH